MARPKSENQNKVPILRYISLHLGTKITITLSDGYGHYVIDHCASTGGGGTRVTATVAPQTGKMYPILTVFEYWYISYHSQVRTCRALHVSWSTSIAVLCVCNAVGITSVRVMVAPQCRDLSGIPFPDSGTRGSFILDFSIRPNFGCLKID